MAYKDIKNKRIYDKKWFKDNPEKRRTYEKKWRGKNPDKVKAQKDRYYEKNKEYIKQKSKQYYENVRKQYLREHIEEERIKNRAKIQIKLQKRRELLKQLREEAGGQCVKCGYNEEMRILQFHHHGKNKKANVTEIQSLEKMREEAKKCILLCPNCHTLTHLK